MFVVLIEDRHSDVDVELYSDRHKAIERARALAVLYCWKPEEIEESVNDCILRIQYSSEGDSITVLEREVE